ncbi:phage/plasmid primase, P4 family [Pimelobacter simplex]|uniref:phage/plasmid primase, P4 family n=1 Tax=Nocardioides simplex TaxID=2045 RepID=UPI003AAD98A8
MIEHQASMTTPEQLEALDVARGLAAAGVPVFVARPDPRQKIGFRLPNNWQFTVADPAVVDTWLPGSALCAVMGHGLDLLDVDPHKGGDLTALGGHVPMSYGVASTPSGGMHSFIASIDVHSRDNVLPGVDVKAGAADGEGRGFAFIAPTVKPSKVTGEPGAYRWIAAPDATRVAALRAGEIVDDTGATLRALIEQVRATAGRPGGSAGPEGEAAAYDGPAFADMPAEMQAQVRGWVSGAIDGVQRELKDSAGWAPGQTDDRGRGWEKLQADAALRLGRLARATWNDLELADAEAIFLAAAPVDGSWGSDDVALKWNQQHHRLDPAPWPEIRSAADRDAQAWAALGVDLATVGSPEAGGDGQDPSAGPQLLQDAHVATWVAQSLLRGRYCWSAGFGWRRWDGRRWRSSTEESVCEVVRLGLIEQQAQEARAGATAERIGALAKLLSAARIRAVTALARGILEVDADRFDRQPDLLNVGNGVIDLATGDLRPHDPELLLTKVSTIDYRPDAQHADWHTALQALPDDVVRWLQVRIGQAATGHMTPDDLLPVLQGGGSNGKTTVMAAIRRALGDHAVVVPERVLLSNPSDHPTELMTLHGARLALIEETPEARHLNVKRLKDIVGTPTMTARLIRKDNVTWEATHSLLLTSNYCPRVDESDHGTWRRLALVRFRRTFSGADGDPGLRDRLRDGRQGQLEAVLAWVVAGARTWYAADRIMPPLPALVEADTREWRSEADHVLAYLDEQLTFDPSACVLASELLADFNMWVARRGGRPWADQTFAARFGGHAEIDAHEVRKTRVRDLSGVSRKGHFAEAAGGRPNVWIGVRWQTSGDHETAGQSGLDGGGQGHSVNALQNPLREVTGPPPSTPVQTLPSTSIGARS